LTKPPWFRTLRLAVHVLAPAGLAFATPYAYTGVLPCSPVSRPRTSWRGRGAPWQPSRPSKQALPARSIGASRTFP